MVSDSYRLAHSLAIIYMITSITSSFLFPQALGSDAGDMPTKPGSDYAIASNTHSTTVYSLHLHSVTSSSR